MDDGTFVKLDFKQIPGAKCYISTMRWSVPSKFKYIMMDKFANKLMIWQGICSCVMKSNAFVTSSTLNHLFYINEYLQNRVFPIIRSHHSPVKFWTDLASCHYAGLTKGWYEGKNVDAIPVEHNPPNSPQLRPIEHYWAIVKRKLKKDCRAATDIKSMQIKWNKYAGTVTPSLVRKLMGGVKRKVRAIAQMQKKIIENLI